MSEAANIKGEYTFRNANCRRGETAPGPIATGVDRQLVKPGPLCPENESECGPSKCDPSIRDQSPTSRASVRALLSLSLGKFLETLHSSSREIRRRQIEYREFFRRLSASLVLCHDALP